MSEQNAVHLASPDTYIKCAIQTSVCRQGFRNFLKKQLAQFISYLAFIPLWGESLDPIHFRIPSLIFTSLVAKYLAENGVSGTFFKKLLAQFISYMAFTLMGWVSWPLYIFVFLVSFLALWWPNIWPKIGFPELFEKNVGSFHFIPGIYPYGVSLLTPINFVFLASFSALWWPNICGKFFTFPNLFT